MLLAFLQAARGRGPLVSTGGNEKLPTPTDTVLCISHTAARAEAAPTTSEPRTTRSEFLARDTPPTRCGGRGWRGFRGRSGCCCINAGQSDLAYVGREYGATGFAKHGSELPRVAFRGLTMSRARLWGGQQKPS